MVAGERFEGESLPQSFSPKEDGKYGPPSDLRRAGPPLQLNHYPVQSLTFFETVKMKRGAADTRDNEFIRTRAYFDKCVTIARLYSAHLPTSHRADPPRLPRLASPSDTTFTSGRTLRSVTLWRVRAPTAARLTTSSAGARRRRARRQTCRDARLRVANSQFACTPPLREPTTSPA